MTKKADPNKKLNAMMVDLAKVLGAVKTTLDSDCKDTLKALEELTEAKDDSLMTANRMLLKAVVILKKEHPDSLKHLVPYLLIGIVDDIMSDKYELEWIKAGLFDYTVDSLRDMCNNMLYPLN